MGKKVTVISTSLRHGSNSAVLADAFAMGASEAGNEVTLISLTGKDIHFCTGCLACQKTGKCVIHDDMNDNRGSEGPDCLGACRSPDQHCPPRFP